MRIFKFVFGGLLVAVGLGITIWFLGEKIVLAVASYQLRGGIAELKRAAYRVEKLASCETGLKGYQLRFVSETEYVIEPVCSGLNGNPIKTSKLFAGVRRLYGSGVMIEIVEGAPVLKDAWVHLVFQNSQSVVGLFAGMPRVVWKASDYDIGGESPAEARCADWGFSCCQNGVEAGEFLQVRTYDCFNNCYQHCNKLPLVLYFNTQPVVNSKTRQVVVQKADPVVNFGYSVSDDEEGLELEIDFGDGKTSEHLPPQKSGLQHEYKCVAESCVYQVIMRAKDKSGNGLVKSDLNEMTVIVR